MSIPIRRRPPRGRRARRRAVTAITLSVLAMLVPVAGAQATTLYGTVGPGFAITFENAAGVPVKTVTAGKTFTVVVRDRSDIHNFRLTGPGVAKSTTVAFTGTATWTVRFRKGSGRYDCVPHSEQMRGSFRIV